MPTILKIIKKGLMEIIRKKIKEKKKRMPKTVRSIT